jgi:hypothetical protein
LRPQIRHRRCCRRVRKIETHLHRVHVKRTTPQGTGIFDLSCSRPVESTAPQAVSKMRPSENEYHKGVMVPCSKRVQTQEVDRTDIIRNFQNESKQGTVFLNRLSGVRLSPGPPLLPTLLKLTGLGRPLPGRASSDIFDSSTPHFASFSEQFGYDECTRVPALNRGWMPRS